jgi:hypothetical protein
MYPMEVILKASFSVLSFCCQSPLALLCPHCRTIVQSKVYNEDFTANLFVLILPLAVLLVIGIGIYFSDTILFKLRRKHATPTGYRHESTY